MGPGAPWRAQGGPWGYIVAPRGSSGVTGPIGPKTLIFHRIFIGWSQKHRIRSGVLQVDLKMAHHFLAKSTIISALFSLFGLWGIFHRTYRIYRIFRKWSQAWQKRSWVPRAGGFPAPGGRKAVVYTNFLTPSKYLFFTILALNPI